MKRIKLGEALKIKRGASLSGKYYSASGKLIRLTLGNFCYPESGWKVNSSKDNLYYLGPVKKEYILKKGDIITPLTEQVRGLLGNTATIPESEKYIQSGDIGLVIPNEKIVHKRYLYYLLSSYIVKRQLDSSSQQTKIRHTSPTAIENCYAYILSIQDQIKLSKFADLICEKIEINNRINDNLSYCNLTIHEQWQ